MRPELSPLVAPRAGLGAAAAALDTRACTIAYMGASVTAQKHGYRPRLHELLCQQTGQEHRAVGAGTGAMGAISGVFLMERLVLRHRPDLCFVEYATSDAAGTTPFDQLEPALEGIVHKLREHGCACCFLYLYRADGTLDEGSRIIDAYERVAARYGVPSIDLASASAALLRDGALESSALVRDDVHTTELGSELVAQALARGVAQIAAAVSERRHVRPGNPGGFARARLVEATAALADGAEVREGRFRLAWPYIEIDSTGELRFTPDGELVGLLLVLGPASGYIRLEAPASSGDYLLWDEQCSYERLGSVVFTPFARAGEPVRVRQLDRRVDYAGARIPVDPVHVPDKRLKLLGLMICP